MIIWIVAYLWLIGAFAVYWCDIDWFDENDAPLWAAVLICALWPVLFAFLFIQVLYLSAKGE
ncbi:hypothetical protein [Nitratireductor indicus]|uniref:hypothetical protein n=1 Tax=Nitratireductor indicus TaxID=721133 RepID=UPI00287570BC|nr:hypothetical protein [Nitratireductor indicus]MDS1138601.1 hypothetical protein [Nitratireductor indicus]